MQTHYQTKQKKLIKNKIYAIALASDFSLIKKFYTAEEMYNCDFKYIAEFSYDKQGKVSKIDIYTEENKLVSSITDYDIKNVDLNYLSRTKHSYLMQGINTEEGIKNLFFKKCLCSN